jgi:FK506-binding protein 4/5
MPTPSKPAEQPVEVIKEKVSESNEKDDANQNNYGKEGNEHFNIPPDATVEYIVTLQEFEKEIESWKLDPSESLAQVKLFKEKGTNYFKLEKFKLALRFWEKCGNFLSNCGEHYFDDFLTLITFLNYLINIHSYF